jgi:nodulation protein A
VAHLGVLRRFLRAPNSEQHVLVGDVGLVAVDPNLQHQLPFGFLTCRPEVVPFYQAGGWHRIEQQVTRMIGNDQAVETYQGGAMIMPVHGTLGAWPTELVDRNGLEV